MSVKTVRYLIRSDGLYLPYLPSENQRSDGSEEWTWDGNYLYVDEFESKYGSYIKIEIKDFDEEDVP